MVWANADADFIVHAREDIPALLSDRAELMAEVERIGNHYKRLKLDRNRLMHKCCEKGYREFENTESILDELDRLLAESDGFDTYKQMFDEKALGLMAERDRLQSECNALKRAFLDLYSISSSPKKSFLRDRISFGLPTSIWLIVKLWPSSSYSLIS